MLLPFIRRFGIDPSSKRKGIELAVMCVGVLLVLLALTVAGVVMKRLVVNSHSAQVEDVCRLADADDAALLRAVREPTLLEEKISAPALRRELHWRLLSEVMRRGLFAEVQDVADAYCAPDQQPESEPWAVRMLQLARAWAMNGQWEKARACYRNAERAYAKWKATAAYQQIVRERAALVVSGCGSSVEDRIAEMQAMLELLPERADARPELRVFLGHLYREQGDRENAANCYRTALKECAEPENSHAFAQICLGEALIDMGDKERARALIDAALSRPISARDHAMALYAAMGWRDLAALAMESGHAQTVLDQLYRSGSLARGKVPANSLFWISMAEQRAWALYVAQAYDDSLRAFHRVLEELDGREEKWCAQPLEGVARCMLALGQAQESLGYIEKCVSLHEQFLADDKDSMGRVCLLLAQVYDQAGMQDKSAETYAHTAAAMPPDHALRPIAMAGQASALENAQKWEDALQVWQEILSTVPEDESVQRESVTERIENCRKQIQLKEQAAKPAPQAAPKPAPKPARARQTTKKSSSRSRKNR